MKNCCNLYFLSTLACKIADCLSEEELAALSADLVVLGDMLVTIIAKENLCKKISDTDC